MKNYSIILLFSFSMFIALGEIYAQPGLTGMIPGHDYAGLSGMAPGHAYAGLEGMAPGHGFHGMHEKKYQGDDGYRNYLVTDSAYVYRWDLVTSDWQLYQVQHYSYSEGRLIELLTRNCSTGVNVALSVYTYNPDGRAEASTNYSWVGEWVPSTRYMNEYDSQGKLTSLRLQKWVGGSWSEERLQQNYQYDSFNRAILYETIYWRSNAWTLPTVSELSYNALGQLEYHLATRPGGAIDYRIVYEYNDMGSMTQFYTQYPAGGGWSNWNLRSFHYDGCGERRYQIQYTGRGPDWIPSTKTEFFTSFSADTWPGKKVPVCHKGHTIWVAAEAVPAHLRHGDCLGECAGEDKKQSETKDGTPFSVYPNPARETITVRFENDCNCTGRRVDLTDFAGNLIKSYKVSDDLQLVIDRGNLRPGKYFIRMSGREVFTIPVVLE